ncbi:MAG: glycosyl transferase [Cyanobacteria bacterium DS2.3.42]|nr:glycosyl transferase [Cyanobacteria bacterium DS2.3.42]
MPSELIQRTSPVAEGKTQGKKFLLLTDIPPCRNFTAGLVLDQLCSFLPAGSVSCFTVLNRELDPEITHADIPIKIVSKPKEHKPRHLPGKIGALESFLAEKYTEKVTVKKIARQAAEFGTQFGADAVWCVVQGQTMIRLANQVADLMNVPLLTEVWDPPTWWLRANKVDSWSQNLILADFASAMKKSVRFAAASWAMAESYESLYGCRSITVIPSLDAALAKPPATGMNKEDELTIGMAGQLYSSKEWENLLLTLKHAQWKIGNRNVKIKVLGRAVTFQSNSPMNVEYLGWRTQAESIDILSQMDVMYCPYWFDPVFKEEASLSFPSKLTTYLATGRPVFFHGPDYASPAKFLKQHNAAVLCHDLARSDIYNQLDRLVSNAELYRQTAENGSKAFHQHLTLDIMRKQFAEFLGLKVEDLKSDE